jgi:mannitol/fructose-specific phosphotransferase system IIA component
MLHVIVKRVVNRNKEPQGINKDNKHISLIIVLMMKHKPNLEIIRPLFRNVINRQRLAPLIRETYFPEV